MVYHNNYQCANHTLRWESFWKSQWT